MTKELADEFNNLTAGGLEINAVWLHFACRKKVDYDELIRALHQ